MIKALLTKALGGSGVVPVGNRYFLSKATVGHPAIFIDADSGKAFATSAVKQIIVLVDEVTVETQNTVYLFESEVSR